MSARKPAYLEREAWATRRFLQRTNMQAALDACKHHLFAARDTLAIALRHRGSEKAKIP